MYGFPASVLETCRPSIIWSSVVEGSIVNTFLIIANLVASMSWGDVVIKANSSVVRVNLFISVAVINNLTLTVIGLDGNSVWSLLIT